MTDETPKTMLTVKDVARILGVGIETVRRRAREGAIEGVLLHGRSGYRFLPEDVAAYQNSLKSAFKPGTPKTPRKD